MLFALINLLYAWSEMISQIFWDQALPISVHIVFQLLSLTVLLIFNNQSYYNRAHKKVSAKFFPVLLIIPAGFAFFSGIYAAFDALRIELIVIGTVSTLWLLGPLTRNSVEDNGQKTLFVALSALILFALITLFSNAEILPLMSDAHNNQLNHNMAQTAVWIKMLLAMVLSLVGWKYLELHTTQGSQQQKHLYFQVTQYALIIVLLSGWWFTNLMSSFKVAEVENLAQSSLLLQRHEIEQHMQDLDLLTTVAAKANQLRDSLQKPTAYKIKQSDNYLANLIEELKIDKAYLIDKTGAVKSLAQSNEAKSIKDETDSITTIVKNAQDKFSFLSMNDKASINYFAAAPVTSLKDSFLGFVVFERNIKIDCLDKGCVLIGPDNALIHKLHGDEDKSKGLTLLKSSLSNKQQVTFNSIPTVFLQQKIHSSDWHIATFTPIHHNVFRFFSILLTLLFISLILIGFVSFYIQLRASNSLIEDKNKLEDHNEELKVKANTDPLTGAYNRLMLNSVLEKSLEKSRIFHLPLSIIMFDIDHFKRINDTYGHQAGDEVLKTLTRLIQANIRSADLFARIGGEEFLILCHGTGLQNAYTLAEKLRLCIKALDIENVGKISCSFGVGQFKPGEEQSELLERIDAALYRAKEGGRNQVVLDDPNNDMGTEQ